MSQSFKPLSPKTRLSLVFATGAIVVVLFGVTLSDFLSVRERLEEDRRYTDAIVLARQADTFFQLAISKGKNFAILKDDKNKRLMLDYFQKAKDSFARLEAVEQDPASKDLLYKLGASLRAVEFPLGILASTAKPSDPPERLYRRYLKDITTAFDNSSQAYVDHLEEKIAGNQRDSGTRTRLDLLMALMGALLALAGMGFSFAIANKLSRALEKEMELEGRLQVLNEVAEEAVMIHEQGIIVEVNLALCRMLGYSEEEMVGRHVGQFQDVAATQKLAQYIHQGYPEGSYEIAALRKDGTTFPLLVHGRDLDYKGRKMRVSSGWDVTNWKKVETALRENRERFERFAEVAKEGILVHENGIVVDMNPALEQMTDWTRADLVGTDGSKVLSPDSQTIIQGFRRTGYPKGPYEISLCRRDGTYIPVEVHGREFMFGGKILRVASLWDLRERKKSEEAVRKSEERFKRFASVTKEGIYIHDDGVIVDANETLAKMVGLPLQELIGKREPFFRQPQRDRQLEEFKRKGFPETPYELEVFRKDGTSFPSEVHGRSFTLGGKRLRVVSLWDIRDRKEAEEELKISEEKFRSFVENSYDLFHMMGPDTTVFYVSPSVERILGHGPESLTGHRFVDWVHPDDTEAVRELLARIMVSPGMTIRAELRLRHKNGSYRVLESSFVNLMENMAVRGVVANSRDITERKHTEEALRKSEELFRTIIEKSNDVISLVGRDGNTLYVSPSVKRVMGYYPVERVGRPFHEIIFPEDRAKALGYFDYILKHPGEAVTARARVLHKEGMWRELEGTAVNHLDNPDVGAIILNYRDITEKVLAEERALENQERYRSLVESMPDAVLVHDDKKVLFVNPAALRLMRAESEKDLIETPFWDMIPFEGREDVLQRIRRVMDEGLSNEPAERTIYRRDGSPVEVLVTSVPFMDRGRRVVLAILSDVSARKEAERKAQRFQRLAALGEMAAGMAHEIRNPTAAISVQAQYLLKKTSDESPTYESLKDIIVQCERLETLVRDTLDYSPEKRFEERTEVAPRALLDRALWLAQAQFGPNHARTQVVLDSPEDQAVIPVHPTRMERVLVNLIINAFQAMPESGGHLLLKSEMKGKYHVFRIEDDGKGFTEEEMARLFEPFYTSRKMGSGLGLAICQKIVGEHQGQIRAERVSPHGAAFIIEIPVKQAGSEPRSS